MRPPSPDQPVMPITLPLIEWLRLLGCGLAEAGSLTQDQLVAALARVVRNLAAENSDDFGTASRPYTGISREPQSARPAPLLLRVRDAARLLAVSERVVWQLIRTGRLRPIRPAGLRATRIAAEDVEELARRWRAASQDGTVELT